MFAPLDPEDLEELAGVVEERRFDPGMDLCREGDAGDAVFLIVRGHVRVFTGGRGGRSGRVYGRARAARQDLPGRYAVRQPAGCRGRAEDA